MNERINPPAKVVDLTAQARARAAPRGSGDKVVEKVDEYFKQCALPSQAACMLATGHDVSLIWIQFRCRADATLRFAVLCCGLYMCRSAANRQPPLPHSADHTVKPCAHAHAQTTGMTASGRCITKRRLLPFPRRQAPSQERPTTCRAREVLVMLAEPGDGRPTLPPEELAQAVGLAFAFVHRGGALVSGMGGRGCLVRKARAGSCLCGKRA